MTHLLSQFILPAADQARLGALYEQVLAQERPTTDIPARLRALDAREARLRQLYEWGDLDDGEYGTRRGEIRAERVALQQAQRVQPNAAKLVDISGYIADMARAWDDAESEERYELARLLFTRIWVYEGRIAAFEPTEELAPFFTAADRVEESVSQSVHRQSALASWLCPPANLNTGLVLPPTAFVPRLPLAVAAIGRVVLTPEQRQTIVARRLAGEARDSIAADFHVKREHVTQLVARARRGGAL